MMRYVLSFLSEPIYLGHTSTELTVIKIKIALYALPWTN